MSVRMSGRGAASAAYRTTWSVDSRGIGGVGYRFISSLKPALKVKRLTFPIRASDSSWHPRLPGCPLFPEDEREGRRGRGVPHHLRCQIQGASFRVIKRSLKLSPGESHMFKTVSPELCPSDGRSRHIAADVHRPCEGARHCQAFSFGSCRVPSAAVRFTFISFRSTCPHTRV